MGGRVDHVTVGRQAVAHPERVEQAEKMFEKVHVEMEPGDVFFFQCNVLHTSAPNLSELRRFVLISSYNTKKNDPYKKHHHAQYTPMTILENDSLKKCDLVHSTEDKWWMQDKEDDSFKNLNLK